MTNLRLSLITFWIAILVGATGCGKVSAPECPIGFKSFAGQCRQQCENRNECFGQEICDELGGVCVEPGTMPMPTTVSIDLTESEVTVTESDGEYDVSLKLSDRPSQDIVLTITSSDEGAARVEPSTLTIAEGTYADLKTIKVIPVDDDDTRDEEVTVTISGEGVATVTFVVTITDPDVQALNVTPNMATIAEGETATVSVSLAFEPDAEISFNLTTDNSSVATANPTLLTVTPGDWKNAQTVVITTVRDLDLEDETANITVAGGELSQTIMLMVTDVDTQNILLSQSSLMLTEDGPASSVDITLAQKPSTDIVVAIASADSSTALVEPLSLTFTPENYAQAQSITVSPVTNNNLVTNNTTIDLSTDGVPSQSISVAVANTDVQTMVISDASLSLTEGETATITVSLQYEPSAPTDVTATASTADVTVGTNTLTFDASNYQTAQSINVTAQQDMNVADVLSGLTLASAGLGSVGIPVNITDDDTLTLIANPTTLSVAEDGLASFTVVLSHEPSQDVIVDMNASGSPFVLPTPNEITFTSVNYATPVTINVNGLPDSNDHDDTATITVSGSPAVSTSVSVTITDNDVQNIILNPGTVALQEDGAGGDFTVRLAYAPLTPITVTLTSTDADAVAVNPATLIFDANNYDTEQTVTASPVVDDDIGNETVHINARSTALANLATRRITVTVEDQDIQSIVFDPNSATVDEGGNITVGVRLAYNNLGPVEVTLTSADTGAVTLSPGTLNFDANNWSTLQDITLNGEQDLDASSETTTILAQADVSSIPDAQLGVTVIDDDEQRIVVSNPANRILELTEGASGTIAVNMAFQPLPGQDITVNLTSSDNTAVQFSPAQLTFDSNNYLTPQSINVVAQEDVDFADKTINLKLTAAGQADVDITTNITDDDTQDVLVNATMISLDEGQAGQTFTVRLAYAPGSQVTVNLASSDNGAVNVSPPSLSFDANNFDQEQIVTVSPTDDNDTVGEVVTVSATHLVGATTITKNIQVNVVDDDIQDIQFLGVANDTIALTEGQSTNLLVRLAFDPTTDLTVFFTANDPSALSIPVTSLQFTAGSSGNWANPQILQVTAQTDTNVDDSTVNITFVYGSETKVLAVDITDPDIQALVVTPNSLNFNEGSSGTIQVSLAYSPGANPQTVSLTADNGSVVSLNPSTLNFSSANYNQPISVTIAGLEDDNLNDESVNISVSATNIPSVTVPVTVNDIDEQSIVVSQTLLNVTEDATTNFTVRLAQQPNSEVFVDINSSDNNAAATNISRLSFDSQTWNVPQTVDVTGVDDTDTNNENVTLSISSGSLTGRTIAVTVSDPDVQAISLSSASLNVTEGLQNSFTVRLAYDPVTAVTLAVQSADTNIATVSPDSVTIDSSNYLNGVNVTVSGVQDQDVEQENVNISVSGASSPTATLPVTVIEDDTQAINVSSNAFTIGENGTGTLGVSLAFEPSSNVTVTVESADGAAVSVNSLTNTSLTFTTSNYANTQNVTLTGVTDADLEDESVLLTLRSGSLADVAVSVSVNDDDVQGIQVSSNSLTLTEGGANGTFTVQLTQQPSASVTLNVNSADPGAATASPSTLTFDGTNYNQAQVVTVAAIVDTNTDDETVNVTVSGGAIPAQTVVTNVTDPDVQQIQVIDFTGSPIEVSEGDSTNLQVRLAFDPVNPTTVNVVSSNSSVATVSPSTLTFTSQNYESGITLAVSTQEDTNLVVENITLTLSNANANDLTVPVNVTDDDTQSLVVAPTSIGITEGGTGEVSIALAFEPSSNVTVTAQSANTSKVGFSGSPILTFTSGNYSQAQTLTLSGEEDSDTANESVVVTISSGALSETIDVSVTDNDALNLNVSTGSLNLDEGGGAQTFQVSLTAQPATDTDVTITSGDPAVATVSSANPITFTTVNWNQTQTVSIVAPNDDDTADNDTTITVAGSGLTPFNVNASVADDDVQAITTDSASLTITEGGSETFNARLAFNPLGTVTITLSSSDPGAATVTPSTLVFNETNYANNQQVTINAVQDADLAGESPSINLQSAVANTTVNVSVNDDDTQEILVNPATISLQEDGSTTFSVTLAYIPAANEIINLSSADPNAASVQNAAGGASLTFTPGNYNQAQVVTVNGVADADTAEETVTISVGGGSIPAATVVATVTDIDVLSLIVSETSLSMVSGGPTQQFTVALSAQPASPTTVSVVSATTAVAQVNPGEIIFTTANWASPVPVTVTAPADDDAADDSTNISVSSSGLTPQTVSVSATDNDIQAIVVSNTSISLTEGGNTTFGVQLAFNPLGTVNINMASSNPGAASLSSSFLTFDETNWNMNQVVTVNGEEDVDLEDESVDITLSTGSGIDSVTVNATLTDDDTQAIQVSANSFEITEGNTATLNVTLAYQPSGTVTVDLASSDDEAVGISATSLVFNAGNYNQAQAITLTAVQDDDLADETVTIAVSSGGLTTENVSVNVTEDDSQSLVVNESNLSLTEGGATQTFSVFLAFRPAANTNVSIVSSDTAAVGISATSLTFAPGTYNLPQVITVTGVSDDDTNDEVETISVESTSLTSATIDVNVDDDDVQAISVVSSLTVDEGSSATLNISLDFNPVTSQDVTISSANEGAATVSVTTLTFTSANYQAGIDITVNGMEDNDVEAESVTLTLSSAIAPNANVSVTVNDNDTQAIQASETSLNMDEGANDTFTVTLAYQPSSNVQISVNSTDSGAASPSPTLLTFTPENYNQAQTVTIDGISDGDVADEAGTITLSDTSASIPDVVLSYTVTDDDIQALSVTPTTLNLTEGAAQSISIALAFQPASDVTVSLTSSDPAKAAAASTSLTFTPGNYSLAQLVSISAVNDMDLENETETITVASTALTDVIVSVDITDDDEQEIVLQLAGSPAIEDGVAGATLEVTLAFEPSGTVNFTAVSSDPGAATVDSASFSLNASNYNLGVPLLLTPVSDNDTQDESVTFTVSSAGLSNQAVTFNVTDDDTQDIVVSANSLTIAEGGSQTFTVSLAFNPVSDLNVSIATADPNLATVSPNTLTFTEANYSAGLLVTVNALEDIDVADESVDLTVSSGILPGNTETVAVSITDNDTQTLSVSPTSLEITENTTGNLNISLVFQPSADVLVDLLSLNTDVATIPPATQLRFTSANYDQAQQVTIQAEDDLNTVQDSTTVNVTSPGLTTVPVAITAPDDDVQNIVVSQTNIPLTEGGGASNFDIQLAFAPASTVNVNISTGGSNKVNIDSGITSFAFSPTDWDTPRTVTISAVEDNDTADENVTITVSDAATTNSLPDRTITVPVTDDDVQAIELDTANVSINEGEAVTVRARLAFNPLATTDVSVNSGDPGAASVSVTNLSFSDTDYNSWQDVVVTAEHDQDLAAESLNVTFSSAVAAADAVLPVTITDDDTQALVTTAPATSINEGDNTTFTVALEYIPGADVTLALSVSDGNKLEIAGPDVTASTVLTFTSANYSTPQTVTVTAQQDNDVTDEAESVSVTATGLSYSPSIAIIDDDSQGITLTANDLTGTEGTTTESFTVRLDFDPEGSVTLNLTSADNAIATVDSGGLPPLGSLSFDSGNYSTPQSVFVNAQQDNNLADATVLITVADTVPGSTIASTSVTFSVEDEDVQSIVLSPTSVSIEEGDNTNFAVSLEFEPAANTVVTVASAVSTLTSVSLPPATPLNSETLDLTFTPTNYATPQDVIVYADHDNNVAGHETTVNLSATGIASQALTVNITDDDTQALVLSTTNLGTIDEGTTTTFTVALAYDPLVSQQVALAVSDTGAASLNLSGLTFDSTNFAAPQTVIVTGSTDSDPIDEDVTIDVSSTGMSSAEVSLTINDEATIIGTVNLPSTGTATFNSALSPAGELEAIRLVVASDQVLLVDTFSGLADVCDDDLKIRIYNTLNNQAREQDDDGIHFCAALEGRVAPASTNYFSPLQLTSGTWHIVIEEFGNNAIVDDYRIVVDSVGANICGNGVPETGEQCDDGNTTDADGCSAGCTYEGITESGSNDTLANAQVITPTSGGISIVGGIANGSTDSDWYSFTVPDQLTLGASSAVLHAWVNRQINFHIYTELILTNAAGTTLASDYFYHYPYGGPEIIASRDNEAILIPGETYYLHLRPYNGVIGYYADPYQLNVVLTTPRCGDGYVDAGGELGVNATGGNAATYQEQCDDGNTVSGDGCSSTCTYETLGTFTTGGNVNTSYSNSIATETTRRAYQVVIADEAPATHINGSYLTAAVYAPSLAANPDACSNAGGNVDPYLEVFDSAGNLVASDDFDGPGSCPLLDSDSNELLKLSPGTYTVVVREDGQNSEIGLFELQLSASTADACGNARAETYTSNGFVEGCDDGNVTNGDGCDSNCQLEATNYEIEENGSTGTAHVIMARSSALGAPCDAGSDCDTGICTAEPGQWGHCTAECSRVIRCAPGYTCEDNPADPPGSDICWRASSDGGPLTYSFSIVGDINSEGVTSISAGGGGSYPGFACSITTRKNVWCWGDNSTGQLGSGDTTANASAQEVLGLSDVIYLSAGFTHACAVVEESSTPGQGQIYCWGTNNFGEVGSGSAGDDVLTATPISAGISNFTQVSTGFQHTCGRTSAGAVYCWGFNQEGQLGNGTPNTNFNPTASLVSGIGTGADTATFVEAGVFSSFAITSSGEIYSWGDNGEGQMANGTVGGQELAPNLVSRPSGVTTWTQIDVNVQTPCALGDNSQLYCWGLNGRGQVGNGNSSPSNVTSPSVVLDATGAPITNITEVATAYYHVCARQNADRVLCWGRNIDGEVGDGSTASPVFNPVEVVNLSDPTQLALSWGYSCAMRAAGGIVCWGQNTNGVVGNGTTGASSNTPVDGVCRASGYNCETDQDYYAFDIPDGWHIRAYAREGLSEFCGSSASDPQPRLYLKNAAGSNLVSDSPDEPSYCPRIDPNDPRIVSYGCNNAPCSTGYCEQWTSSSYRCMDDSNAKDLDEERHYIQVEERSNNDSLSQYLLTVEVIPPGCGNGVVEYSEQCDDGNTTDTDDCSNTCVSNTNNSHVHDPLGSVVQSTSRTLSHTLLGQTSNTLVDLTGVTTGELYIDTQVVVANEPVLPTYMCRDSRSWYSNGYYPDPRVRLYQYEVNLASGNTETSNIYGATFRPSVLQECANLSAELVQDPSSLRVSASARYWIEVSEDGYDNYFNNYDVVITTRLADQCGNGVVETYLPVIESCDDGNTISGDGCDSNCAWEITQTIDATSITSDLTQNISVTFNSASEQKIIRVSLADGQSLGAAAGVTGGVCNLDTKIDVTDINFVTFLSDDNDGEGLCAQTFNNSGPSGNYADHVSDDLPAGTYHLIVSAPNGTGFPVTTDITVEVTATGCGNGTLEHNAGEACDSGNPAGDISSGCNALCQIVSPIVNETESNNLTSLANSTGISGVGRAIVSGLLEPLNTGGYDYFSFVAPNNGLTTNVSVRSQGNYNDPNTCKGWSTVRVRNSSGTQLCYNSTSGYGYCGFISACNITADGSTYYVEVRLGSNSTWDPQSDWRYFLDINVTQ